MGARWTRLVTRRPLVTVLAVLAGLARPGASRAAAAARPARQLDRGAREPRAAGLRPDQRELRPRPQRSARRARREPRPGDGRAVRRRRSPPPSAARPPDTPGEFRGGLDDVAYAAPTVLPDGTTADRHGHPGERAAGGGDQRARRRAAGPGARAGGGDRRGPGGHRSDGGGDRRLRPARRRAAALRPRRGGPRPGAAPAGLPVDPRADQGRRRLPAVGRRLVRRGRRGLPVGLVQRPARRARDGPGHQLPAGDPHGGAVRAGDGLRGLPRLPHARGVRARRRARATPSSPGPGTRRGSSSPRR